MSSNMELSNPKWIRLTRIISSISSNKYHHSTALSQVLKVIIRRLLIEEVLKLRLLHFHIWTLGLSRWWLPRLLQVCLCLRRTSTKALNSTRLSMRTLWLWESNPKIERSMISNSWLSLPFMRNLPPLSSSYSLLKSQMKLTHTSYTA